MKLRIPDIGMVRLLRGVILVSGSFSLLIAILLTINWIQLKRTDPLNSPALVIRNEQLIHDPGNVQLQEEIRQLDLLARKAFFTSQWQIRTGGYLLLAGLLIMVIAWKILEMIRPVQPVIPAAGPENLWMIRKSRRPWIIASGAAFLAGSLVLAWFAQQSLISPAGPEKATAGAAAINKPHQDTMTIALQTSGDIAAVRHDSAISAPSGDGWPSAEEIRMNALSFRGPGSNGNAFHRNIPVSWDGSSGRKIRWKTAIPLPGFNSPILWKDKLFLSGASKEGKKAVYGIDAGSGKILWTTDLTDIPGSPGPAPKVIAETGQAAPSMTTDGRRVYALFANGDLAALSMEGTIVWTKNLGLPKNHYGHSSSLIMYRDLLIIQYDQTGSARVMALQGRTGEKAWETTRNVKVSWASPVLVNTGTRDELILAAEPSVISYDPATGRELWKMECIGGEVGPSVAYANGLVFSVNDYSKLAAIRLGSSPEQVWESDEYLSDIPSPVASGDLLFLVTSYGTLVCYDAAGGEKLWEKELGNTVYASPMIVDGKLYVLDKTGLMHIFRADRTLTEAGTAPLGEGSVCTPVFGAGRIWIRGLKNLYCIEN